MAAVFVRTQTHSLSYCQAKRTMDDFRWAAKRIDACRAQTHRLPADRDELLRCVGVFPQTDGWGRPWSYVVSKDGHHYQLTSIPGKIVMQDGTFIH